MAKRLTVSIEASGGTQRIVLNTTANDGKTVAINAINNGLDGTGVDVDFFTTNSLTNIATMIGITLGSTPLEPATNADIESDMLNDVLYLDFEPNDATVGTVDLTITFK